VFEGCGETTGPGGQCETVVVVSERIVFLPGTSGRGAFWEPVQRELPHLEATLVDWPGVGGTSPEPGVDSYDGLVAWTIRLITAPSVLVGQSMGGYVALRVALERPDLVTHLVLAVTSGGLDRAFDARPDWRQVMKQEHPDDPGWLYDPQPSLELLLPSLRIPVLLVWADLDPISPVAFGHRLNELLPNSRLVVYESHDHWIAQVRATDVASQITTLLQTP
jgi:pimeloyl-ACP methyl ester carboxylesterase